MRIFICVLIFYIFIVLMRVYWPQDFIDVNTFKSQICDQTHDDIYGDIYDDTNRYETMMFAFVLCDASIRFRCVIDDVTTCEKYVTTCDKFVGNVKYAQTIVCKVQNLLVVDFTRDNS